MGKWANGAEAIEADTAAWLSLVFASE